MLIPGLLLNTIVANKDRCAVEVAGKEYSYEELLIGAYRISLSMHADASYKSKVALFAERELGAYFSILYSVLSGCCYVPVNIKYPISRIKKMMILSDCKHAIVTESFLRKYGEGLREMLSELNINVVNVSCDVEPRQLINIDDCVEYFKTRTANIMKDDYAYVMFTSGSTGEPKGVPISYGNLESYLRYVVDRNPIEERDRCSQFFDLTFDPSVHDILVTWLSAATLCVPTSAEKMLPAEFIVRNNITVWYSVPSVISRLIQLNILRENIFPALRCSIFSGEALPASYAHQWMRAAVNSSVINYYGPTEVTINITYSRLEPGEEVKEHATGFIAIGEVFDTHTFKIVDEQGRCVPEGESGELLIAGSQVTKGYLNTDLVTSDFWLYENGKRYYRTGDIVTTSQNGLMFIGRRDQQIKIRGFRVELAEIEEVIRKHKTVRDVAVVPIYSKDHIVVGTAAFVVTASVRMQEIRRLCLSKLPDYMIPSRFINVSTLPMTDNGKINRRMLYKQVNDNE